MNSIPPEIIFHISSLLPLEDRVRIRRVCWKWHQVVCDEKKWYEQEHKEKEFLQIWEEYEKNRFWIRHVIRGFVRFLAKYDNSIDIEKAVELTSRHIVRLWVNISPRQEFGIGVDIIVNDKRDFIGITLRWGRSIPSCVDMPVILSGCPLTILGDVESSFAIYQPFTRTSALLNDNACFQRARVSDKHYHILQVMMNDIENCCNTLEEYLELIQITKKFT